MIPENNTVVVSDAIVLLKKFADDCIPLIIADPPYGISYHSNYYKDKNPHAPVANDWNFQISGFLHECQRVLVEGGALYLFSRWDVYPLWLPAISTCAKLNLKTKIVWMKNNWSAGDLTGCFGNQYEEILFITKGRHKLRGKRWPNVWPFDRIPSTQMLHPTQKPVPLLKRAILSSSDVGDVVIDPFAGSGSTGEAARQGGRIFILGDIDPKMVKIACARLGLPIQNDDYSGQELTLPYELQEPNPAEWGIHPEELRFILDEIQGNVTRLESGQMQLPLKQENQCES